MVNTDLIKKTAGLLSKDGVSVLMVAPGADMKFLLGHAPMMCERYQALFVKDDGSVFYICNALYEDEISEILPGAPIYTWFDSDDFTAVAARAFEENGLIGKRIAVNGTVRAFNLVRLMKNIDFIPENGKDYLELTRIIKTPEELENLRRASLVADKVFEDIVKFIKPGMTEKDIKDENARLCRLHGGQNASGGIVAVGANAAMPHYLGGEAVVTDNCSIVMDFGCTVGGMYSDITRTVFVGHASPRQRQLYKLVLKANLTGEKAAVNGAYIPDVDAAARKVIEDEGLGKYFNHRLGHGIGYAGHEAPYIHGDYHMHLAPGMAFSCEPGIYIKDEIGIRIEDVVIINEKGETEVLNKCTKELIEILPE